MKKIILVTGAGSGLGKEVSKLLSPENIVIGADINSRDLKTLKKETGCEVYSCDISKASQASSLSKKLLKKYKKIDCLINSAGVWMQGKLVNTDDAMAEKVVRVNILGAVYMSKYFLPLLSKSEAGLIVNIISQGGLYSKPERSVYGASKWGMTGFTKHLSSEVMEEGIRVTGIYPGKMDTALFGKLKAQRDMSDSLNPALVAKAIKFVVDQPSEVHIPELGVKSAKQLQ